MHEGRLNNITRDPTIAALHRRSKLIVILVMLAGVLTNPAFSAELSKQDCIREASLSQRVNLSAGVVTERIQITTPLHINLPANVDSGIYYECLLNKGLVDAEGPENYVAKQDECRSKSRLHTVESDSGRARINDVASDRDYLNCMASDVSVKVLDGE